MESILRSISEGGELEDGDDEGMEAGDRRLDTGGTMEAGESGEAAAAAGRDEKSEE